MTLHIGRIYLTVGIRPKPEPEPYLGRRERIAQRLFCEAIRRDKERVLLADAIDDDLMFGQGGNA